MSFKIEFNELVKLLEAHGEEPDCARIIADYLDECIDYELDLSYYLWNTLLQVNCFDTKKEAFEYMKADSIDSNHCILWEGNYGVYLEKY